MDTNQKKPWESKTLITNLVLAIVAMIPAAQDYVVAHPMLIPEVLLGVNFALRIITKDKISLQD